MLHFVIPFKSKKVSKNWKLDSYYCLRTIRGLLKQTCDAYTVTLACHQRPAGFEHVASNPKVRLVERPDFWVPPDPSRKNGLRADKDRKLRAAMADLRSFGSGYVMPMDADDAVHIRLTEYVLNTSPDIDLLYAEQGYIYDQSTGLLLVKNSMHRRVGTSLIARWSAEEMPENENDKSKPSILVNSDGHFNHSQVVDKVLSKKGLKAQSISFPSVCYVVGTGVQIRGGGYTTGVALQGQISNVLRSLLRFWQLRYPSEHWRRKFGLE